LIKLGEDFEIENGRRFWVGYLHHLVNILWGDEEEEIPRRRNNGFLVRDVVGLALE
jgi:hypothetical protein